MNLKFRNLVMMKDELRSRKLEYSASKDGIKLIVPGNKDVIMGRTKVLPYIVIEMKVAEDGIMMIARTPCRLRMKDQEEDLLLRTILEENFGTIRGGVVYDHESRILMAKTFVFINEEATGFKDNELLIDMEMTRSRLVNTFRAFVSKKNERDNHSESPDAQSEEDTARREELLRRLKALFEEGGDE